METGDAATYWSFDLPVEALGPRTGSDAAPAAPERDAALVERVRGGDSAAYRPLVERYQRPVFGLLRRLLNGDRSLAEDLTQETLVRAYEYLDRLENPERFGSWVFQIARSLVRDALRRARAEQRAIERRFALLRVRSVPAGEGILESGFRQLPQEEQAVLKLRYFEGWTYDQIADKLGLSFSQVDHLIRKARGRLGRRLNVERERERSL
jgi:RNA polymerase sigma-70 factor (ECF subfamily)